MNEIDFAALLCSRLCHDLISPVSAVSNGIEILDDETDPEMRDQVFDLIKKSSEQSSSMVQFYRAAFGSGGGLGDVVEMGKTKALISSFLQSKKITLNWQSDIEVLSKNSAKLLLNLVLIASESLVRGGEITLFLGKADEMTLAINVSGDTVILYPPIKEMFAASDAARQSIVVEPRTAPVALIFSLASDIKASVSLDDSEDKTLRFLVNWPANSAVEN
ncbi:MAG: histidine phosphotransferase [Sphingomonadales bacterium]|nr:histidine phosphotransferase [Sphingomonadales bacterium]